MQTDEMQIASVPVIILAVASIAASLVRSVATQISCMVL